MWIRSNIVMSRNLFAAFLLLTALVSCDPCPDCGKPLAYESRVKLVLINLDSANALGKVITEIDTTLKQNAAIRTGYQQTINVLNDSIETLEALVTQGDTQWTDEIAALGAQVAGLLQLQTQVRREDSVLNVQKAQWNRVRSVINSGRLAVENITLVETGGTLQFPDSITSIGLPLLLDRDEANYEITINDRHTTSLQLQYTRVEEFDQTGIFRIRGRDIQHTSPDSSQINCNTCWHNETTVTIYF